MPCTRGDFEALAKSSGDQRKTSLGVIPSLAHVTHLEVKMSLKQRLSFEGYKGRCCSFHYVQQSYSNIPPQCLRGSGELLKNHMGVQQVQAGNRWSFSEVTEDSWHIQLDSIDNNKPVCLKDITVGDSLRNGWLRTNASAVCPRLALLREAFQARGLSRPFPAGG